MKKLRRATRAGDRDALAEAVPEEKVAIGRTQSWTAGSQLGSRVMLGLLVVAVAAGPVGGWRGFQGGARAEAAAAALAEGASQEAPAPELFVLVEQAGQEAVEAWLSATRDDHSWIDAVLPGQVGDRLPVTATAYSSVMPVKVEPSDDGLWSVTVSANVKEPILLDGIDGGETDEADMSAAWVRRYYLTTVQVDGQSNAVAAVTLPAPVGVPQAAERPDLPFRYSIPANTEVFATIGSFLEALLAGSGEVDRYLTPGAVVDRLPTPAYQGTAVREAMTDVTAERLQEPNDGATARVLVGAELTRFDGMTVPATYVLDLTSRSGRWEITAITTPSTTTTEEETS